jgi:hypothetical protein
MSWSKNPICKSAEVCGKKGVVCVELRPGSKTPLQGYGRADEKCARRRERIMNSRAEEA